MSNQKQKPRKSVTLVAKSVELEMFTWSRHQGSGTIKGGRAGRGSIPVCTVTDTPEYWDIKQARKLALELLRWADFEESGPIGEGK